MVIVFYKNSSDKNVISKTISNGFSLTGFLRDETEIINPVIRIDASLENMRAYNYAYIPDFDRYYYITGYESDRTNIVSILLHVDVLMSFANDIKNSSAIIDKSQGGNLYLNDGTFLHDSREFYTIKNFANGFNDDGEYILITAGGIAV